MYTLKKDKNNVEIEISIDNKTWEEGENKVYQATKSKFNVVGFRKGHAPKKVIEKQYGDSVFFDDTVNHFVNETIAEVLQENTDLEPIDSPHTHFQSYTKEGGLKMTVHFQIVPDFELCKYEGVELECPKFEATQEDVDAEIKHLLDDNAKYEHVDREVKMGDSVIIDYMGFFGDTAFDGGTAEDYPLEIGSKTFIDTFEEQLVGHKAGETVNVNVKFPDDYGAKDFQGKDATFKVTIKDVREKIVPELNDKFISDTTEFETVEEYRKHVFAHIQNMKEQQRESETQYVMRDYLIRNTEIEIPESMVETHIAGDIDRMIQTLKQFGMSFEEYIARTSGGNVEDFMKQMRETSYRGIKSRYIFNKIIREQNLDVTDEEVKKETQSDNENEIIQAKNKILIKKLFDYLKKCFKIKYV